MDAVILLVHNSCYVVAEQPWKVPQQKQQDGVGLSPGNMENGLSSDLSGKAYDSLEPWWKKKTVKITELDPEAEELRRQQQQPPVQRSWVPPQPPSVTVPEAAAAIRQPKSAGHKQQFGEAAHSDDGEASLVSDDSRIEPPGTSNTVFAESNRSEIEEENESAVGEKEIEVGIN